MEPERRQRRTPNVLAAWSRAQADLIDEIVSTAARITAARSPSGEPIYRTDGIFSLLRAIDGSHYCCAIADAARLLGISRPRAPPRARGSLCCCSGSTSTGSPRQHTCCGRFVTACDATSASGLLLGCGHGENFNKLLARLRCGSVNRRGTPAVAR